VGDYRHFAVANGCLLFKLSTGGEQSSAPISDEHSANASPVCNSGIGSHGQVSHLILRNGRMRVAVLVRWNQQELADAAGVGVATIRLFEAGKGEQRRATLSVITQALEAAGVEFTNGEQPGVRLAKTKSD
jgi:DNA-binding Xre family transcriptional regulator